LDREYPDHYRREEIQVLVKAIESRENRLVLGLPGIGKSNLLRFLVAKPSLVTSKTVTFIYLNCEALDNCLDHETFFEAIAEELREQGLEGKSETERRGYARLKRLMTSLRRERTWRAAIVVDQADKLLSAADETFYTKLEALTDLNKRICYIFGIGPTTPVDPDNALFAGRRLAVGRLNDRDCRSAIAEEARRLGVKFGAVAQERLAHLTGGYPGMLRAVSSAVVQAALNLSEPEATLVERLLDREDVQSRCRKIWGALDRSKQDALKTIASRHVDTIAANALEWLRDFGLVDERNGEYGLFSPIFEGFVTAQEGFSSPGLVTIVGGKVFRGGEEVTLRPLAQKLLTCLMAEPGRVYTHDEIARYVWDTEEVTPDMIAGLVSELRSRLEKDYIRTHHKRGYEFVTRAPESVNG
jgi:hypothetical protein